MPEEVDRGVVAKTRTVDGIHRIVCPACDHSMMAVVDLKQLSLICPPTPGEVHHLHCGECRHAFVLNGFSD